MSEKSVTLKRMRSSALFIVLILNLPTSNRADDNQRVKLCAVLKNPSGNDQKQFVITAGFRVGYEWQELLCYDCPTSERVWVEFDPAAKGISKLPKSEAFHQLYKVTLRGTFEARSHRYGHENGYAFQFRVMEVKSAKLLWSLTPGKTDIPVDVKSMVCE